MDVLQNISVISKRIMSISPYYGLFLTTLDKRLSTEVPTMGLGKSGININLLINEEYWKSIPENIREGSLQHELLHLCLQHLSLTNSYPDKELLNIATDCEVNSYIKNEKRDNDNWATVENLNERYNLNLKPSQGTNEYYSILSKLTPQQQQQIKNDFGQSGNGNENEDGESEENKSNGKSKKNKSNKGNPDSNKRGDHNSWKKFDQLSETEKKLIEKQVQHQMKAVAESMKNRGLIPAELQNIIEKLSEIEEPKFDWKGYMRRFAGGSTKIYTKKTRYKQSRRYEGNPGLKIKQKKHILVFNDSSGSVSDSDYQEFIHEIHHISKTGTEVTIADFDTDVQNVRKFNIKTDTERSGYGGTDFNPPMEYYNKNKNKYCSCIVFTDGYCSPPSIQPNGKILWVICSNGTADIDLPGFKIKLEK